MHQGMHNEFATLLSSIAPVALSFFLHFLQLFESDVHRIQI